MEVNYLRCEQPAQQHHMVTIWLTHTGNKLKINDWEMLTVIFACTRTSVQAAGRLMKSFMKEQIFLCAERLNRIKDEVFSKP